MNSGTRPEPGLSPERLVFFTDALFAIAMTLLAVELERPHAKELASARALGHFLVEQRGSYLAFVLAFVLLWSVWRRHHKLMDEVVVLSKSFVGWHAPFLLLVAFLPFPTAVMGTSITNPLAQTLFAGTMAAMLLCEAVIKEIAAGSGLIDGDPALIRRHANGSWAVGAWFLLSAGLAWLVSYAFVLWFVAPLAATYGGALISRLRASRPERHEPPGAPAPRGSKRKE
ncbi:TMEM175 family protein [Streptomyces sp. NPDC004111]|uniref:TMEM175 family protein n=1 Tax=Streptomyces sp. NPDC004111 TaxID=3364690 RepID=UPI0036A9E636